MPSKRVALFAVGLYHATNDGTVIAVAALFPILLDVGLIGSFTEIGLLTLVGLFVTVVFQIVFGAWSDKTSPRLLLPAGMVILGVAALFTSLATSFAFLLAMVALARVGASVYHPVGIAWVGKSFKEELDHAMGSQSAFGDFGVIVAFASSGFLGLHYGWQVPFLLWGGLALAMAALGYALTAETETPRDLRTPDPPDWVRILRQNALWILPLSMGGAAYIITISYGNSFLVERLGLTADLADVIIALWIGAGVVAAYAFGRISTLLGRFRALTTAFLVIGVAGFVIGVVPPLLEGVVPPLLVLIPTFILFGVALFITYPALFAFISETTEDRIGGATFGVVFGFQLVGGAVAGYGAGVVADLWGIHTPFLLLMALGLATFLLLAVATPTSVRNRRAPAAGRAPAR